MARFNANEYANAKADAWVLVHVLDSPFVCEYEIIPHSQFFDIQPTELQCRDRVTLPLYKAIYECYIVAVANTPDILQKQFITLRDNYLKGSELYEHIQPSMNLLDDEDNEIINEIFNLHERLKEDMKSRDRHLMKFEKKLQQLIKYARNHLQ